MKSKKLIKEITKINVVLRLTMKEMDRPEVIQISGLTKHHVSSFISGKNTPWSYEKILRIAEKFEL